MISSYILSLLIQANGKVLLTAQFLAWMKIFKLVSFVTLFLMRVASYASVSDILTCLSKRRNLHSVPVRSVEFFEQQCNVKFRVCVRERPPGSLAVWRRAYKVSITVERAPWMNAHMNLSSLYV